MSVGSLPSKNGRTCFTQIFQLFGAFALLLLLNILLWSKRNYYCIDSIAVEIYGDIVEWKMQLSSCVMCDGSGYHVSCRESMFIYILLVGRICRTFGSLCAPAADGWSHRSTHETNRLAPKIGARHACTCFHGLCQSLRNSLTQLFRIFHHLSHFPFQAPHHFHIKYVHSIQRNHIINNNQYIWYLIFPRFAAIASSFLFHAHCT